LAKNTGKVGGGGVGTVKRYHEDQGVRCIGGSSKWASSNVGNTNPTMMEKGKKGGGGGKRKLQGEQEKNYKSNGLRKKVFMA